MKIVIIGSVIFSKNLIDDILKNKFEIKGIIGKKNNKFNSDYFDIVKYFKEKGINCTYSKDINNKRTYNWIKKINPDLIICLGWSRLLNKKILSLPNIGAIGYHPADIPSNKGRHPIIWSLALGLKKAASTFFLMNEKPDSGKIISKKFLRINKKYYAKDVYKKLSQIASKQLIGILKKVHKHQKIYFLKNKAFYKDKKENFWRKRNFEDGKIDWRMGSKEIFNLVKALSWPYPGAHFFYKNKLVKLYKVTIKEYEKVNIEPGKVVKKQKNKPVIKCGDNAILLNNFYPKINIKLNSYLR